jgi:DNA-binding transcriptional regulator LsrR (DeoR family)
MNHGLERLSVISFWGGIQTLAEGRSYCQVIQSLAASRFQIKRRTARYPLYIKTRLGRARIAQEKLFSPILSNKYLDFENHEVGF